jgi:centrosomal protein CEP76
VLLCNLLIGFGLDAYVCVGTNGEGSHAWVMQRSQVPSSSGVKKQPKIVFWESLTGEKLELDNPRVHRFYRQVGCVFNNKSFFANVQSDDRVVNVGWDLEDEYMWKAMNKSLIATLQPSNGAGYLMPSHSFDVQNEERLLEKLLKDKVAGIRRNDGGNLLTNWDSQLSYLLQTALSNYEFERISQGSTFANDEFQASIQNYVPEGHTFKAFPI